jgi:hypothetical protein
MRSLRRPGARPRAGASGEPPGAPAPAQPSGRWRAAACVVGTVFITLLAHLLLHEWYSAWPQHAATLPPPPPPPRRAGGADGDAAAAEARAGSAVVAAAVAAAVRAIGAAVVASSPPPPPPPLLAPPPALGGCSLLFSLRLPFSGADAASAMFAAGAAGARQKVRGARRGAARGAKQRATRHRSSNELPAACLPPAAASALVPPAAAAWRQLCGRPRRVARDAGRRRVVRASAAVARRQGRQEHACGALEHVVPLLLLRAAL